jgi:hypothetical protein
MRLSYRHHSDTACKQVKGLGEGSARRAHCSSERFEQTGTIALIAVDRAIDLCRNGIAQRRGQPARGDWNGLQSIEHQRVTGHAQHM